MSKKRICLLLLFIFIVLIAAVIIFKIPPKEVTKNSYYFRLMGESQSWELEGYQVKMTPKTLKSGNGKLTYKPNPKGFATHFFEFNVHAIVNNQDKIIQHKSVTGPASYSKEFTTGSIKGPILTQNEKPITAKDLSKIYAVIKWENNKDKIQKEKIVLYR